MSTMASIQSLKSYSDVDKLAAYSPALPGIVETLTDMVIRGDKKGPPTERSAFNGSKPAPVSIQDYLIRICKYGYCSPEVFICVVIYLARFRTKAKVAFNSYNIHRLILTSFVVAAKLRDDTYYSNKYYASIGGVNLQDMNRMEHHFLRSSGWELHVDKEEYDQYFTAMTTPKQKLRQPSAYPSLSPTPENIPMTSSVSGVSARETSPHKSYKSDHSVSTHKSSSIHSTTKRSMISYPSTGRVSAQ